MMNKKEFFSSIARDWEEEHRNAEEHQKLRILFSYLKLNPGQKVLDIGGGTGRLIPYIRKKIGASGTIVEADFSEKMVAIARENHDREGTHFLQCSAENPPLADKEFDAVICFAAFPHFSDKMKSLKEFRRILKPGKLLYIAHLMSRKELNQFHKKVKGPVTRDFLPSLTEMKKLFKDSGFHNLRIIDRPSLYIASAQA